MHSSVIEQADFTSDEADVFLENRIESNDASRNALVSGELEVTEI